jgi:DNA-binding NtrC family response regulator
MTPISVGPGPHSVVPSQSRTFGKVVSVCPAMHDVFDVLGRLARTEVTITLMGETGSGKDVLAHTVHAQSARSAQPFVVFDCGAIAANLAESELFGHEKGSFTGAFATHAGAFERAHRGTLFLDEVGELPLDLQPRLLRVLESRSLRRVGGALDREVDVRVVAATNRDLAAEVSTGRFRQDLYFRLAAAVVSVPPLRDRIDDLPLLIPRLLADLGHADVGVAEDTLEALRPHPWTGNVRELKNALAYALAFVDDGLLQPRHFQLQSSGPESESILERLPLGGKTLQRIEEAAIRQTLAQTGGNKALAARKLDIAVSTLYEKLKKYNLT